MNKLEQIKNLNPKKNQPPLEKPNLSPNLVPHIKPPVVSNKPNVFVPFVMALIFLFQILVFIIILYNYFLNLQLIKLETDINNTYKLVQKDISVFNEVDSLSKKININKIANEQKNNTGSYAEAIFSTLSENIEFEEANITGRRGVYEINTNEAITAALLIQRLFDTGKVDSVAITAADLNDEREFNTKLEILFL